MNEKRFINIVIADEGWELERFAKELNKRLDYVSLSTKPDPTFRINYYMNFAAFCGKQPGIDIGFLTYIEPTNKTLFLETINKMDINICISQRYAIKLVEDGVRNIHVIEPGVDLDNFRPIMRIGVVGKTYERGRKSDDLIKAVMDEPNFEWFFTGKGWPGKLIEFSDEEMPKFYGSIDYILIPEDYIGEPKVILEALACGREVIAASNSFVLDYPHIEYKTGNVNDLRRVLHELIFNRNILRKTVLQYSWYDWAIKHDALFRIVLRKEVKFSIPPRMQTTKILLAINSSEQLAPGGPSVRVLRMKDHLERNGLHVEISTEEQPDTKNFDLVHVFSTWPPDTTLQKLRYLHNRNIPIVFSPVFLDLSEFVWASRTIPSIFKPGSGNNELDQDLELVRAQNKIFADTSLNGQNQILPGYFSQVREMVSLADHLIGLSKFEMEHLWAIGIDPKPYTLVQNAVDYNRFHNATKDKFINKYGIQDFVLCVGRIEPRKNQLMLLHSLRYSGIPVVLVGQESDPDYSKLVRSITKVNVFYTGQIPNQSELLPSAYAAAKVFCLPSWAEGAPLSALEAAASGTALVLSNRSGESEYFGEAARYCDPSNPDDIRDSIINIYQSKNWNREKRDFFNLNLQADFTWENAAKDTIQAYNTAREAFDIRLFNKTTISYEQLKNKVHQNTNKADSENEFHLGPGIFIEPIWNWLGKEGHILIDPRNNVSILNFELKSANKDYYSSFPLQIELLIDNIFIENIVFDQSEMIKIVSMTLNASSQVSDVCLKSNSFFIPVNIGLNLDDRALSVLIRNISVNRQNENIEISKPNIIDCLDFIPDTELDGFYTIEEGWRWLRKEGHIRIIKELLPAKVSFKLNCSQKNFYSQFPFTVDIFINNEVAESFTFNESDLTKSIVLNLPYDEKGIDICLKTNSTFIPHSHKINDDFRELSVRLGELVILPYAIT